MRTMKSALLVIMFAAACSGGSKKPATETTTPVEHAAPADGSGSGASAGGAEAGPGRRADDGGGALDHKPADDAGAALAQAALTEQYELGKKVFVDKKCASCHGDHGEGNPKNPAVIGDKAFPEKAPATSKLRKGVTFKTAKDVLDFVKAKMPLKTPGSLSDDEAAAVTAWMLSETKVNVTAKLDASNAASVNLK